AHDDFLALQPRRRFGERLWSTGGRLPGLAASARHKPACGHQDDVRALCTVGSRRRVHLLPDPAAAGCDKSAQACRAGSMAPYRLQAGGAVQSRRLRRRLRRAVAAGALALRAIRTAALVRKPFLLLVGRALGLLVSGRSLAVAPCRTRKYHGLHTHPVEHLSDTLRVFTDAPACAGTPAGPRSALADGCADAIFLRHGSRHRG